MRSTTARAEEQARRIETVARGEAAEIVAEAEARAAARTRQIEQWAEQVVSHTRAEEARQVLEQQRAKDAANGSSSRALGDQRGSAIATLTALREALGRAVGLVEEEPAGSGAGEQHSHDARRAERDCRLRPAGAGRAGGRPAIAMPGRALREHGLVLISPAGADRRPGERHPHRPHGRRRRPKADEITLPRPGPPRPTTKPSSSKPSSTPGWPAGAEEA